MFYPFYKSIKDRLMSQMKTLRDVQWFNDQYSSGKIHAEPLAFIEFPDLVSISGISKQSEKSSIQICIHIVSKVMSENDASVSDSQIEAHDQLADAARTALDAYQLTYSGASVGTKLQETGFRAGHEYKGWLVVKIFYTTKQMS